MDDQTEINPNKLPQAGTKTRAQFEQEIRELDEEIETVNNVRRKKNLPLITPNTPLPVSERKN